jgi:hypothetical protein
MNVLALAILALTANQSQDAELSSLDFGKGRLSGWETRGNAFYVTTASGRGPSLRCGVCSSDRGVKGRTGLLRKELIIPADAAQIRFHAYAARTGAEADWPGTEKLDVVLAAGEQIIPKRVLTAEGWRSAPRLLPRLNGKPREYRWDVAAHPGRSVQIIIGDDDDRPGAYVACSGFRIVRKENKANDEIPAFVQEMAVLTARHDMAPAARYDSRHFTALSNADDRLTRMRLKNCELIYSLFFEHFRRKGFQVREPSTRLMIAMFDSPTGFDAYFGQKLSPFITGIYHRKSNRLVVYDYGRNEEFLTSKQQAIERGRNARGRIYSGRYEETVERLAREFRTDINIGTVMHEVAHQLSFSSGMLNREGDVPVWLAEGLACYCESTDGGAWEGIGEPNPQRLIVLARHFKGKGDRSGLGDLVPLRALVSSDRWRMGTGGTIALGYAQSWALFRMFMEERPRAMQNYLAMIYSRRAPDHRLTDFRQAFGADLSRIERQHAAYLMRIAEDYNDTGR